MSWVPFRGHEKAWAGWGWRRPPKVLVGSGAVLRGAPELRLGRQDLTFEMPPVSVEFIYRLGHGLSGAKGCITGQESTSVGLHPELATLGATITHSCSHLCHLLKATQDSPGGASHSQAPWDSLTLAAPVVVQQDVARRAGAEVRAGLVHTLVLAEELREAALVHVWG